MATLTLRKPTRVGFRAAISWLEGGARKLAGITAAKYTALAEKDAAIPAKPASFTGTDAAWAATWAASGVAGITHDYNTPSGNLENGDLFQFGNGTLVILFKGKHFLRLRADQYTGTPPSITATVPLPLGASIVSGIFTVDDSQVNEPRDYSA